MDKNSLSHTTWKCKCHLVFAPKYRRNDLEYDQLTLNEYIDPFTGEPVRKGRKK